jgi:hypothetical protein
LRLGVDVEHVDTAICASRNETITAQGRIKPIPPSARGIIHPIGGLFEARAHVGWEARFRWKLAHNVARRIVVFPLEEGGFQIEVDRSPGP